METFEITLSQGQVKMQAELIRKDDVISHYNITAAGVFLCTVYPDHGTGVEPPLVWRCDDKHMDRYLIGQIGKQIESYHD